MKNWKKYYNQESELVKNVLQEQLHRNPEQKDYERINLVRKLNSNLVYIYLDDKLIDKQLLIADVL
jgi:hypothetical protein